MDLLKRFYLDVNTRESVEAFMYEQLNKLALRKMYNHEDVRGIAEAKEAIQDAFSELASLYKEDQASKVINHNR